MSLGKNDLPVPEGLLSGTVAIECTAGVAGAFCGKLLADLGARVIKVEPPGVGDPTRHAGPFPGDVPHPEKSGLFLYLNTNKSGVTLDLGRAKGQALLHRLASSADALIEDTPPSQTAVLGLDYSTLIQVNPRLIVASVTPFGKTGPYRDYRAYHLNIFHAGGEGITMGPPEMPPVRVGGRVGEYDSGLVASVAVLAALYARMFTGRGQHIDLSQQEACAALGRVDNSRYPNGEALLTRSSPRSLVGGLLPCSNGYAYLTITHDHMWQGLLEVMGNPDWAQEDWCQNENSRAANAARINALISQWSRRHTKEEVYHLLQAHGAPIGPIVGPEELLASPQLQHRRFFVDIAHPVAGRWPYPRMPFRTGPAGQSDYRPAPTLGEHNSQVYDELGLSPQEVAQLREGGIV